MNVYLFSPPQGLFAFRKSCCAVHATVRRRRMGNCSSHAIPRLLACSVAGALLPSEVVDALARCGLAPQQSAEDVIRTEVTGVLCKTRLAMTSYPAAVDATASMMNADFRKWWEKCTTSR